MQLLKFLISWYEPGDDRGTTCISGLPQQKHAIVESKFWGADVPKCHSYSTYIYIYIFTYIYIFISVLSVLLASRV